LTGQTFLLPFGLNKAEPPSEIKSSLPFALLVNEQEQPGPNVSQSDFAIGPSAIFGGIDVAVTGVAEICGATTGIEVGFVATVGTEVRSFDF
jgi:hypothetical protein